jgi:DnaK suppressor protein
MRRKKMTAKERRRIEQQLTAMGRQLSRTLRRNLENVRNTSSEDPSELLDIAADGEMDFMSAVSAQAGSAAIGEIETALMKLREGTYGRCEGCGEPIAARRLQARPFAVLCLTCKEHQERYGYVEGKDAVSVRPDPDVGVNLSTDDFERPETSADDVFRGMEELDMNELSDVF